MQLALDLESGYRETPEETFLRVYRQLRVQARRAAPEAAAVRLRWRPYANSIGTLRIRGGEMHIGLSEALRGAPGEVVEALAEVLLAKVLRRRPSPEAAQCYRCWLNRDSTRELLESFRRANGRKHAGPQTSAFHSLEDLFEAMNRRYFAGALARPTLAWSRRASRTHLGHWDPAHQTIVLSRFLDQKEMPRLAAEYVMFHEMLHIVHPVKFDNGRRLVHHPAFREAERQFEGLREAKRILRQLCAGPASF
jgi:hypothetical protein